MSGRRTSPIALAALVEELTDFELRGDASVPITDIAYDNRLATAGGLFVALRGGYFDGHDFLPAARAAGAAAAVVELQTPDSLLDGYAAVVRLRDTRAALATLADTFYARPSRALRVIGVTGTDGKTTTSHLIEAMCRHAGLRTGLIGTVQVRIGDWVDEHESRQTTPESLLTQGYLARMRDEGVDVAVMEATSHGLTMHRLDGVQFDIGVVTNVTHEHLDFHGTLENYRAAKGKLLAMVAAARDDDKLGVAVLNQDDQGARALRPFAADAALLWYSQAAEGADLRAAHIRNAPAGTAFELRTPRGTADVLLRLRGRYNVANALAAAGAGHALGLAPDQIAAGIGSLAAVAGRMESVDEGQPFIVLVDYAHTPEALKSVLREARGLTDGRVLTAFGSAGERDVAKRAAQGAVAIELADYAIFTSEDPRFEDPDAIIADIARGAEQAGGRAGVHFASIEDRQAAIAELLARARPGDVVVLAGKGHEHSMIYGAERRPWSDADAAREALREMGYGLTARRGSNA